MERVLIDEKTGERFNVSLSKISNSPLHKKVGFVIGHYSNGTGFNSKYLGKEWEFWRNYAESYLSKYGEIYYHDLSSSYSTRQSIMADKTKDLDLVFELHFNAHNESAEGAHCLFYSKSSIGEKLATLFSKKMLEVYDIEKDWNHPVSSQSVRGGQFIMKQKPTALLLEPFFADNKNDTDKFSKNIQSFADDVIEPLILEYYKLKQ